MFVTSRVMFDSGITEDDADVFRVVYGCVTLLNDPDVVFVVFGCIL